MADTDTHMSAAYACMCGTFRNSICMSGDGSFLFTAGGSDLTINAWRVDTNAMDAQVTLTVASVTLKFVTYDCNAAYYT
jgi:hypothetical protein